MDSLFICCFFIRRREKILCQPCEMISYTALSCLISKIPRYNSIFYITADSRHHFFFCTHQFMTTAGSHHNQHTSRTCYFCSHGCTVSIKMPHRHRCSLRKTGEFCTCFCQNSCPGANRLHRSPDFFLYYMFQSRIQRFKIIRRRISILFMPAGFCAGSAAVPNQFSCQLHHNPVCHFKKCIRIFIDLRTFIQYLPYFWKHPFTGYFPAVTLNKFFISRQCCLCHFICIGLCSMMFPQLHISIGTAFPSFQKAKWRSVLFYWQNCTAGCIDPDSNHLFRSNPCLFYYVSYGDPQYIQIISRMLQMPVYSKSGTIRQSLTHYSVPVFQHTGGCFLTSLYICQKASS